jgi:uncharacterized membrane protein YtjA (UPF0391 family)
MIRIWLVFLVIIGITGILGFGGTASGTATIAKIFFFISIALFVIALLFGKNLYKGR